MLKDAVDRWSITDAAELYDAAVGRGTQSRAGALTVHPGRIRLVST
jgi:hypothetical protein